MRRRSTTGVKCPAPRGGSTDRGDDTLTRLADGRVLRVGGILECANSGGASFLDAVDILDPAGIH